MNTLQVVTSPEAQKNFYPTPEGLIHEMLKDVDLYRLDSVLEPSAGKGNIAAIVAEERKKFFGRWGDKTGKEFIDCIEIDPTLRAILKDNGFRVVHDDFLTLDTWKHYGLIVMNPPFDKGAEHLLKAISIAERTGSQIICLLNAETLRNPYSYTRQKLAQAIAKYEGTVEELSNAFSGAERKTDVDVAIVRLTIPEPERHSTIFDEMQKDAQARKAEEPETPYSALAKGNFIEALVDRYNYELSCGLTLIREYQAISKILTQPITEEKESELILQLKIGAEIHKGGKNASVNEYVQRVRKKYWKHLFQQEQFVARLTSNLREQLYKMVDEMVDYDFSYYNIYTLAQQMLLKVNGGIEATIMKLFDDWTYVHHWDEGSGNRHYFDGWKTNDAFAVGKKVIIPFYGAIDSWDGKIDCHAVNRKLSDIEKVFDFLDGHTTNSVTSTIEAIKLAAAENRTRNIQCKYFTVTFFKKGTCHIVFTNMDVLHKFNLFAARGKNWLPPSYGKKRYKDMTREEQAVVDSFEGEESYNNVLQHSAYFLETTPQLALTNGSEE